MFFAADDGEHGRALRCVGELPISPCRDHTPALYESATSTFLLRTLNTSGPADYTFAYGAAEYTVQFGTPSPTLKPLANCWATSTNAAAVDRLDLATAAANTLAEGLEAASLS